MQLINVSTNAPEELDSTAALGALAAGTHVPANGKLLINPAGEPVVSPHDEVETNLSRYGYKIPTQAELTHFADQKKYGEGTGNEVKAFLAGAARGPTFGLSDVAMRAAGVAPETLQGLKEYNPGASMGGELAGIAGSALLMPESLVGKVGKLGEAVTEGLSPAALGAGATMAQKVVHAAAEMGAKGLGSAVEGAIYGAGQSVSEAALGDPDLNAQKIAANLGFGALIGGGFGAALKGAQIAGNATISAARDTVSGIYDRFIGRVASKEATAANEALGAAGVSQAMDPEKAQQVGAMAKVMSAMTGEPVEKVQADIEKGMTAEVLTPGEREGFAKSMSDAFQEHYQLMRKIGDAGMGEARDEETAALIKQAIASGETTPIAIDKEYKRIVGSVADALKQAEEDPETYSKIGTKKLRSLFDRLNSWPEGADAVDKFKRLDEVKKDLFDLQKRYTAAVRTIPEQESGQVFKDIYKDVRLSLEDSETWGAAGARQASRNAAYSDFKDAQDAFQRQFMSKWKVKGTSVYRVKGSKVNTYANLINDPNRGGEATSILENYFNASRKLLDEAETTQASAAFEGVDLAPLREKLASAEGMANRAKNIVTAAPGGLGAVTDWLHPLSAVRKAAQSLSDPIAMGAKLAQIERMVSKVDAAMTRMSKGAFDSAAPKSGTATAEGAAKRMEDISKMASDPQSMMDKMEQASAEGHGAAPEISNALQSVTMRGLMFLNSKVQKPRQDLPYDRPSQPSKSDSIKFNRYYEAVHDPMGVLRDLAEGRVVPEKMEAMEAVYPAFLQQMRKEVIGHMSNHLRQEKPLSYQRKVSISRFLGTPVASSLRPANFMANQAQHGAANAAATAQGQSIRPSQKGLGKLDVAGRIQTTQQATAQRDRS